MANFSWVGLLTRNRKLLIIPPIVIALVVLWWVSISRSDPELRPEQEISRALSVIEVQEMDVRPKVEGFGTSKYARTWRAVAQVSGRVKSVHADLRSGAIVQPDTELFTIDDKDYIDTRTELESGIEQTNSDVEQLDQKDKNYNKTLKIERDLLAVYQSELKRAQDLLKGDAGSQASVDVKRRAMLAQQQRIQDIENAQSLISSQRKSYQAALKQSNAKLEQAKRNVNRTKVVAPFLMRIGDVQLEVGQFVATNEMLFEGYSAQQVEVEAQVPVPDVRRLVGRSQSDTITPSMAAMRDFFGGMDVLIHNQAAGPKATWTGKFESVREVFDARTRTIGLVVSADNPIALENPSKAPRKPPLMQGAFCNVTFFGKELKKKTIVPQSAVSGSSVFVLDKENRLRRRKIEIEFAQDDYVVVKKGLNVGEKLAIGDPTPAIEGMLVKPVVDKEAATHLAVQVQQSLNRKE